MKACLQLQPDVLLQRLPAYYKNLGVGFSFSSRETSDGANNQDTTGAQPATKEVKTNDHIVIPYTQGLCESIKKICGRYGIQIYFKGSNTIRNLLVSPRDKDPMVSKSGATTGSSVVTSLVMMNT